MAGPAKSFEEALRSVVAGTSGTGARFLDELVQALCRALGARWAFVADFTDETHRRIRTLARAEDGRPAPPLELDLQGTACAEVLAQAACFHRDRVTEVFPDDRLLVDLQARSLLGVALRASTGAVLGALVVVHDDLLDESLAPEALLGLFAGRCASELERLQLERTQLLARIARAVPGGIYLLEASTLRYVFTSRDTTPIFGFDITTEPGRQRVREAIHPADLIRALEHRARLAAAPDGEVVDVEVRFRAPRASGADDWVWLRIWETVFEREASGRVTLILGVFQDVSAVKQLELDARLRRVFERLPLAASISDPSGRREFVNPAYDRLIGVSIEAAPTVADAIRTLVPDPAEMQRVAGSVKEYRAGRKPGESLVIEQVRVHTAGGSERSLDVHMFEDRDLGITTFVDVTERVRSEAALRQAHAQLAAANRDLESFSYSVSHDLRAPLRHIDGFARALEKELGDGIGADARRHLGRIRSAAQRMDRLIDGVLSLSRVGQAPLRETDVDLSALATELADEHVQAARDRRIEWTIAPGVVARGDATLLRIALGNLLDNAVKYSARREVAHIELGTADRAGRLEAFVRDDGAGFDMRYAHKLFGPFQRLHADAEFAGHGIGLATVARVIGRHGGAIEARGAPDGGATFSFWLPGLSVRGRGS